jgi:uroporphyrinogen decarboxylase
MAFKGGSLVDPSWVKKYMVPRYMKVPELMLDNGIDALILDCDGNCEELMPMWIECGINGLYPFERAANMDPLRLRKQYGKDLLIFGGVDKRSLAAGKAEIDKELEMVKELLSYSGYMPNCDHHITPDISYENIVYFMNELRKLDAYTDNPRFIELNK